MNRNKQKKIILLDQTFLNDKGKRRELVVKVKVQSRGCGGGWGPTRVKLGTLLVKYIGREELKNVHSQNVSPLKKRLSFGL
jgi:hypothetical protein